MAGDVIWRNVAVNQLDMAAGRLQAGQFIDRQPRSFSKP
jgi:hypothetical protein